MYISIVGYVICELDKKKIKTHYKICSMFQHHNVFIKI